MGWTGRRAVVQVHRRPWPPPGPTRSASGWPRPYAVTDALHIANSSGTNLSGSVAVPDTGGYETWTTVTASVTLPAGAADADGRPGLQRLELPLLGLRPGIERRRRRRWRRPARPSTAAPRTSRWTSRPRPPRPSPPPTTRRPTPPTATPAPAGQARPATRSGWRSTSAPRQQICSVAICSGRPRTPRRSRSRCPTTTRTGPRSTPPPPAPAGARRSPSRRPPATSACTARSARPSWATRSSSSTSTA